MKYKIHINNSDYSDWILYNEENMQQIDNPESILNPIKHKLFNCDILDNNLNIVNSAIREDTNIPGILLLLGKTYGRSKNNNKIYYKCIPNDNRLPAFLIPYDQKCSKFNKNITNNISVQ